MFYQLYDHHNGDIYPDMLCGRVFPIYFENYCLKWRVSKRCEIKSIVNVFLMHLIIFIIVHVKYIVLPKSVRLLYLTQMVVLDFVGGEAVIFSVVSLSPTTPRIFFGHK